MIQASDFGALRAFAAVAEAVSFSRAADALGVSPSALSQTVRGLENRADTRLLNRTTRNVLLSEAGRTLLDRVRPALNELGIVIGQLRALDGRAAGTVKLQSFRAGAELFPALLLARFARDYPAIVLDVTIDDSVANVIAGGFDAAIRLGEVIERDMVALRLGPDLRQVAVASPGYLAAHGAPATPHDLPVHRRIRCRSPGRDAPYAWEFCDDGRWFTVAADSPLIATSRAFGVDAAVDGVGIVFAVEEAVAHHIAVDRLVPLLQGWSAPFPGFFLYFSQQHHMAPALRAFVDALRSANAVDRAEDRS